MTQEGSGREKRRCRALLIEDNPGDARLVREMLQESQARDSTVPDFELVQVQDLSTGLTHLGEDSIDVVLLDLGLPDSQGLGTLSRVQARAPDVPVVVLTGLDDEELASEAVQKGAQDYLPKAQLADGALLTRSVRYAVERKRLLVDLEHTSVELESTGTALRRIIDTNADAMVIVDEQRRVRFVNPAAERLLDRSVDELVGAVATFPVTVGEATEVELVRRGQGVVAAEVRAAEIEWEGEPALLASLRDITDRKRTEEALRESQRELAIRSQIAQAFLIAPDDGVYGEVLQTILAAMHSEHGVFGYLDEDGALVCPSMTRDIWDRGQIPDKDIVFPRETWGDSLWGRCLREGKTFFSNEPSRLPEGHVPIARCVAVPIVYRDGVIGEVMVGNKATDYDDRDIGLVERIAAHIAPILSARLERDREERRRQRAEEELRDANQTMQALIEASPAAIVALDADERVTMWNPAAERMFGWTAEEVVGRPYPLAPGELRESHLSLHERSLRGESMRAVELGRQKKDGSQISISVSAASLYDTEGDVVGAMAVLEDITERKRAEDALRSERDRVESYLQTVQVMFVALNEKGEVTLLNRRACEVLGYEEGEVAGNKWLDTCVPLEVRHEVEEVFERLMAGDVEAVEYYESPVLTKSGEQRLIGWHNALITDEAGSIKGALSSGEDVTDRKAAEEQLLMFRRLAEASGQGFGMATLDSEITYANPALCHLFGEHEPANVHGESWFAYCPEQVARALRSEALPAVVQEGQWVGEAALLSTDGRVTPVIANVFLVRDEDGLPLRFAYVVTDITERKQAEQELLQSEGRYRLLFENLNDAAFVADAETGRILETNHQGEVLLRRDRDEIVGMHQSALHPPDKVDRYKQMFEAHLREGRATKLDAEIVAKDGTLVPVMISASAMAVRGQRVVLGLFRDMTETKEAEREQEGLLRLNETTLATIPSSLLVLDAELNVVMANQGYLDEGGVSSSEIVGRNIADVFADGLLRERDLLNHIHAVAAMGGQEEFLGLEHKSEHRADRHLDIRVCGFQMAGEEGGTERRVLLVIDDVTQQHALEEHSRQVSRLESIGTLAGGVAHDFNNILTGIMGYAALLQRGMASSDPAAADLRTIGDLADRAAGLTRQLLAFSRQQRIEPVVIDVNVLIENLAKMLHRLIGEDIELKLELDPNVSNVLADPGQIEQVLVNLAVNARDAMPDGGKLGVETADVMLDDTYVAQHPGGAAGPHVMIAVSDTGCGMDQQTRERIFEPFFTTKEVGQGTGLGLATVYGIVKQHEGNIWVYSELGRGTIFKIYLPVTELTAADAATVAREAVALGKSETILVVEDEEIVLRVMEKMLTDYGFTVLAAGGPDEAERVFAEHKDEIALLLTDLVMPGRGGCALYESLAAEHPSLRVLYTSGYTQHAALNQDILGPDAPFLQKPFTPEALADRIRGLLDR